MRGLESVPHSAASQGEEAAQGREGESALTEEDMRLGPWASGKARRGTGPSCLGIRSGAKGGPSSPDLCPSGPEVA